jgi:hypothetical protein
MGSSDSDLSFFPLTPDRWADFEVLFGDRGACGGCWCMLWRTSRAEFESGKGAGNKTAMQALVAQGTTPGLLAYSGGVLLPRENATLRSPGPVCSKQRTMSWFGR